MKSLRNVAGFGRRTLRTSLALLSVVGAIGRDIAFKRAVVELSKSAVLILDSRFWGENTYLGGKFDTFFNVFCILGVFLGGNLGFLGGIPPQEIAGNNTAKSEVGVDQGISLVG